jgi:hypothetical protein
VAEDGGGGEVVPLDLAHQVVVNVRLPRHLADWISLLTQTEGKKIELEGEDLSLSLSLVLLRTVALTLVGDGEERGNI